MKKIIITVISSAFIVPVAMAEVTVYGSVRSSIEYSHIDAAGSTNDISRVRLMDNNSRLGFKGSDKLDNGLKLQWVSEHRIRVGASRLDGTNNASEGWGNRHSWIGVQGEFGQIRAGRYDDIIDETLGDFYPGLDNKEETSSSHLNMIRRGNARGNNLLTYVSPSFGGIKFKAQYDIGSKAAQTSGVVTDTHGYAATAFYNHKLFDIGAGWKHVQDTTSTTGVNLTASPSADGAKLNYYVVGANVKPAEGLNISFAWDRTEKKSSATANSVKQDGMGLGASYSAGKYTVGLVGALLKDTKGAATNADTGAWSINLGARYALSKQTSAIAGATYVKNDANSALGGGTISNSTLGARITGISVGLRTDF